MENRCWKNINWCLWKTLSNL